mmetsp:Transcript_15342/g.33136  ORF Transcript_15342/g.33136 Transcript_15342/m.33136 type:complete len:257 (+) Transcript_15342:678-1448(+)
MASAFASLSSSSLISCGSMRCISATWSFLRYFTSQMPGGSRMPPRASSSAYISICSRLMVGSTTTHAPPRSSPPGGMYTNTGCLYSRSASTIMAPYLSTSLYMSRVPPEKPRQLAKMNSGSCSPLLKSLIAVAVLKALSGNHTCPACVFTTSAEVGVAGSAGATCSTERVSTAMMPQGYPPRRARPTTTVLPQPPSVSTKEPWSKSPLCHSPSGVSTPASMWRGSYGVLEGTKPTSRSTGSAVRTCGASCPTRRGT